MTSLRARMRMLAEAAVMNLRRRFNNRPRLLPAFLTTSSGLLLVTIGASQPQEQSPAGHRSTKSLNLSGDYVAVKCINGEAIREDRIKHNAEVHAASDPHDSKHIVAAWVNGAQGILVSVSSDGGRGWSPPRPLLLTSCLNQKLSDYKGGADPWVGIGPGKTVFISGLVGHRSIDRQAAFVDISRDGGLTWEDPVILDSESTENPDVDNTSIVADLKNPGFAYVATEYIREDSTSSVGFSRTTNYGKTWSVLRPITPRTQARFPAPQLLIEEDSKRLYGFSIIREPKRNWIGFIYSDDQGVTWSEPREVANVVSPASETKLGGSGIPFESAQDMLHVVQERRSGVLYVVFADARFTGGNQLAISMVSSSDRGKSWSSPVRLSTLSKGHAFEPAVAVNSRNDVGLIYYDTRSPYPEQAGSMLPISIWFRVFPHSKPPEKAPEERLDQFNYVGLNRRGLLDYQALVVAGNQFHAFYTKSNLRPDQPSADKVKRQETDIYFH